MTTSSYTEDLININKPGCKQFLKDIYPKELVISETSESRNVVSSLDLLIDTANGDFVCSILTFDFHTINFPDIPTAPAYGSDSRAGHNYDNFSFRHSTLADRLFDQGFSARELMRTLFKFMGRYLELASMFHKIHYQFICDGVPMAQFYSVVTGAGCREEYVRLLGLL